MQLRDPITEVPTQQQVRNIGVYGEPFEPRLLFSAENEPIAEATHSCDSWWLGTELNGVQVILDSDTGRVVSHGALHAGFVATDLPDELPAPFEPR